LSLKVERTATDWYGVLCHIYGEVNDGENIFV